ncbi:hypothetical protein FZ103_08345 [Streptomonospora sp. PA3]|uniref:hypothetical protein n=1 Tax=Streptomonospora sp. PA3 TaxID=2607326 RepID=UPI0012DCD720|nr:hypothetical protein [Streptomonospora sp. PA3]MUL41189.1 hypothetical protein [Streptomonospora sp. PA3]
MTRRRLRSFAAGLLIANSAPHLATAASGRRHLTPLAGRDSGPVANGVWAGINLAAGVLLLRSRHRESPARWDGDLVAFEAGYLAFALWMAGSEAALRVNWEAAGPQ